MKFPNLPRFAAAVLRMAKAKLKGRKLQVDSLTKLSRQLVCMSCPKWNHQYRQCLECTCFTDWKIPFATESCPLGYWKRELIDTVG